MGTMVSLHLDLASICTLLNTLGLVHVVCSLIIIGNWHFVANNVHKLWTYYWRKNMLFWDKGSFWRLWYTGGVETFSYDYYQGFCQYQKFMRVLLYIFAIMHVNCTSSSWHWALYRTLATCMLYLLHNTTQHTACFTCVQTIFVECCAQVTWSFGSVELQTSVELTACTYVPLVTVLTRVLMVHSVGSSTWRKASRHVQSGVPGFPPFIPTHRSADTEPFVFQAFHYHDCTIINNNGFSCTNEVEVSMYYCYRIVRHTLS